MLSQLHLSRGPHKQIDLTMFMGGGSLGCILGISSLWREVDEIRWQGRVEGKNQGCIPGNTSLEVQVKENGSMKGIT